MGDYLARVMAVGLNYWKNMATNLFIGPTAKNRWVIDGHSNEISKVKDYKDKKWLFRGDKGHPNFKGERLQS